MNDHDRIRAAPADRVAALIGLAFPTEMADRLAGTARLASRFHEAAASRLGDLPPLNARQSAALALDEQGLRATAAKAGAVWYAGAFARVVDGAARRSIVEAIGLDSYLLALEGRGAAPHHGSDELPAGDLAEAAKREGEGCWAAWRSAQPAPVAARLSLLDCVASPHEGHRNHGAGIVDWLLDRT